MKLSTAATTAAAALPVLLYAEAEYFFRYTFSRDDKVPWSNIDDERILFDRDFFERPDRRALQITSRDGLRRIKNRAMEKVYQAAGVSKE